MTDNEMSFSLVKVPFLDLRIRWGALPRDGEAKELKGPHLTSQRQCQRL